MAGQDRSGLIEAITEHERRYASDLQYRLEHDEREHRRLANDYYYSTEEWHREIERLTRTLPVKHSSTAESMPVKSRGDLWSKLARIWTGRERVLMVGPVGCGKTTAMAWAGLWMKSRQLSAFYHSTSMFHEIAKSDSLMDEAKDADILLLDELHRFDGLPSWVSIQMLGLIDYRYCNDKSTIAAGTLPPNLASSVIGEEVVERFEYKLSTNERSYRRDA